MPSTPYNPLPNADCPTKKNDINKIAEEIQEILCTKAPARKE